MRLDVLLSNDFTCSKDCNSMHLKISLMKEKNVSKIAPKINLKFFPNSVKNQDVYLPSELSVFLVFSNFSSL